MSLASEWAARVFGGKAGKTIRCPAQSQGQAIPTGRLALSQVWHDLPTIQPRVKRDK